MTSPFTHRSILLAAASGAAAACAPGQQPGREAAGAAPTPGLKQGVTLAFAQAGNQANAECALVVAELRGRLLDWSLRTQDPRPVPLYFDLRTFQSSETPSFNP